MDADEEIGVYRRAKERGITVENVENLDNWNWHNFDKDGDEEISVKVAARDLAPVYRQTAELLLHEIIESALFWIYPHKDKPPTVELSFFDSTVTLILPLSRLFDEFIEREIHENYSVESVEEFHEKVKTKSIDLEEERSVLLVLEAAVAKLRAYLDVK